MHHGYKCRDDSGHIFISRHVFNENVFPAVKSRSCAQEVPSFLFLFLCCLNPLILILMELQMRVLHASTMNRLMYQGHLQMSSLWST